MFLQEAVCSMVDSPTPNHDCCRETRMLVSTSHLLKALHFKTKRKGIRNVGMRSQVIP